jgi:hypothetical protein
MRWHWWFLSHRELTRPRGVCQCALQVRLCVHVLPSVLFLCVLCAHIAVFAPWVMVYAYNAENEDSRKVRKAYDVKSCIPLRAHRLGASQVRCTTMESFYFGSAICLVGSVVGLIASVAIREVIDDFGIKVGRALPNRRTRATAAVRA